MVYDTRECNMSPYLYNNCQKCQLKEIVCLPNMTSWRFFLMYRVYQRLRTFRISTREYGNPAEWVDVITFYCMWPRLSIYQLLFVGLVILIEREKPLLPAGFQHCLGRLYKL